MFGNIASVNYEKPKGNNKTADVVVSDRPEQSLINKTDRFLGQLFAVEPKYKYTQVSSRLLTTWLLMKSNRAIVRNPRNGYLSIAALF